MKFKFSVLTPCLLRPIFLCLLFGGCRGPAPKLESRGDGSFLIDHLDQAVPYGAARDLAKLPPAKEEVLLSLDFEQGDFAPLTPFGGTGRTPEELRPNCSVVDDPFGARSGKVVKLTGPLKSGLGLRSSPFAVEPGRFYRLHYQIATQGFSSAPGTEAAKVSALFYNIPPGQDPLTALADPGLEKRFRLNPRKLFWAPAPGGNRIWLQVDTGFLPPQGATHLVLSLDHTRAPSNAACEARSGSVLFDDLVLAAVQGSPCQRYAALDGAPGGGHPLKASVQLGHRSDYYAKERREAICAPAPSRIDFNLIVPERAELSFGYGLLPDALSLSSEDKVQYEVRIQQGRARAVGLFKDVLSPASPTARFWNDKRLDLGKFAGQSVKLSFVTRMLPAKGGPPGSAKSLAGQMAVWGAPVISGGAAAGKTIVLIVMDAVGAKFTGLYGHKPDTTPNLKRVAANGSLFLNALSPSPWTLPAFGSILTGLSTLQSNTGEPNDFTELNAYGLDPDYPTLAERLRLQGWETSAWVDNPNLGSSAGFSRGFSRYVEYKARRVYIQSDTVEPEIISYLSASGAGNRFVLFHLMDAHSPYSAPKSLRTKFYRRPAKRRVLRHPEWRIDSLIVSRKLRLSAQDRIRYRQFYEAAVASDDRRVGKIFTALQRLPNPEQLLLFVTADHGEGMGEHGGIYAHGNSIYQTLLWVPLIAYAPGLSFVPRQIKEVVSTWDLAPSILEFAGLSVPPEWPGISLLGAMQGKGEPPPRPLTSAKMYYGTGRLALRQGSQKYIYNQRGVGWASSRAPSPIAVHELYDLSSDPGERHNLAQSNLGATADLHQELAEHFAADLDEDLVVFFDAGSQSKMGEAALHITLTTDGGAQWRREVKDLIWPWPDGSAGELTLKRRNSFKKSIIDLKLQARKGVMGFELIGADAPMRIALTWNGKPLDPKLVQVGEGFGAPRKLPVALTVEDAAAFAPDLLRQLFLEKSAAEPRVVILRFQRKQRPPAARSLMEGQSELDQQIRSLGYVK